MNLVKIVILSGAKNLKVSMINNFEIFHFVQYDKSKNFPDFRY